MDVDVRVHWEGLRRFLPFDLDGLAVETGAIVRRRGVSGGEALARALCLVALPGATLEQAARSARRAGVSSMGKTAVFKRLCASEGFLEALFRHALRFAAGPCERFAGLSLVAVDATVLCGPGSRGTDKRLHAVYDLGACAPRSVELTGPSEGESLARHPSLGPGDLVLADRGYGHARGLLSALAAGASVLVRFEPSTLPLFDPEGGRLTPARLEASLPQGAPVALDVSLKGLDRPLCALGSRNLEGRAVWLLTDLPATALSPGQARELYRRRWQVELFFKRLKSLAGVGALPSRAGPTSRAWTWARLLAAALATLASDGRFSPWGCPEGPLEALPRRALEGHGRAAGATLGAQGQEGTAQGQEETARQDAQARVLVEA